MRRRGVSSERRRSSCSSSVSVTYICHQLISPLCCNIASDKSLLIIWYTFKKKRLLNWWYHAITLANVNWWHHAITGTSVHWWYHAFTCSNVDLSSVRIYCISTRKISYQMLDGNHKTVLTDFQFDPLVTFITSDEQLRLCFHWRWFVCLSVSVCLSVTNITEKWFNGFPGNFQERWDLVQGTIWNIFRVFHLTPWT